MSTIPAVSVIIPTYNRAKTIQRAIDSVLNQTFSDLELIVVDDCSTDNTSAILGQYGGNKRVRIIKHDKNRGEGGARNTGIRHSHANYIAFLDSDDEWLKNKLEKQMPIIQNADENIGVVYAYSVMQNEDGSNASIQRPSMRGDILSDLLYGKCPAISSSALIRRECFQDHLHDETLPSFQDWDLWLQIAQDYQFEYIPEPLCIIYLGTPAQATRNISSRLRGLDLFLNKWGDLIIEKFGKKQVKRIRDAIISTLYVVVGESVNAEDRFNAMRLFSQLSFRTNDFYRGPNERKVIIYNLFLIVLGQRIHGLFVRSLKRLVASS